jgi:hypothetical protein
MEEILGIAKRVEIIMLLLLQPLFADLGEVVILIVIIDRESQNRGPD